MPIQVDWTPSLPRVIFYRLEDQWTWAEYFAASEREFELVAPLQGERYDVIADFLDSSYIPVGAGVSHVHRMNQRRQQQQVGIVVVVTESQFISGLVKIGQKVYVGKNDNFHIARTVREAVALIEAHRNSVDSHKSIVDSQ